MHTIEAIRARRAVKHFDPDFTMPAEDERALFDLARQSPTSFNIQNWRFMVVKDKEKRGQIRKAAWNQAQITDASLLVILCADTKAHEHEPERYWQDAPQNVQDALVPALFGFYHNNPQRQRDEAMRSVGMAAQTLMLGAKALGYDSCPMIGFDAEEVGRLIHLPEHHVIGMIVTIGKATKPAWPKGGYVPDHEIVFLDSF